MNVGDIYLVEIPASGGHKQQGVRPAIVVQTSENIDRVPTVLTVPLTTQIKAANFPFTFVVEPDSTNNLTSTDMQILKQNLENILNIERR